MDQSLFVIPRLVPSAAGRQLGLLAEHLSRDAVRVCVLQDDSPWCQELRQAGVATEVLGWRRPFDMRPLWRLRKELARGGQVHAWGLPALWAVVVAGTRPSRVVLWHAPGADRAPWAARQLVRRCGRVVVSGEADADDCRRLGVARERLAVIPPGVPAAQRLPPAMLPGLPVTARVILCIGPIDRHKGFREAVWTLDILRCLYDDVHLVLVGSGPDEPRIRTFARHIRLTDHVHLTGEVADVTAWLARASVVWVPSLREGGRYAALEAMAAGRPVVASRLAGLAGLIVDGQTGLLVPPGDKAELARQTRALFEHPQEAARLAEAARRHAESRFSLAGMISAVTALPPVAILPLARG